MKESPNSTVLTLTESRWHWKSLVVYLAAIFCLIDAPLQYVILQDGWGLVTSIILVVFLAVESYGRLFRSQTFLGKTFAPILSILIIALTISTYVLHFFMQ